MKNNETDAILGFLANQSFGFYPLDPAKRLACTEKKLATNATRRLPMSRSDLSSSGHHNPAASSFDYYDDMGAHLGNTSDGSIKDRCVWNVLTGCRQNPAISTSFCDFYLCTPVLVTIWYRYNIYIYIYTCVYIYRYTHAVLCVIQPSC